jgi:6-phosphogluconate dehydrogenase (decarboxylating)
MQIGMTGRGKRGGPLSRRLIKDGRPYAVIAPTAEACDAPAADGATVAASLETVVNRLGARTERSRTIRLILPAQGLERVDPGAEPGATRLAAD